MIKPVTAVAHSNIALVKYWGKRDHALNLPAVGSISLTLAALSTKTSVKFDPALESDQLILNGKPAEMDQTLRISDFLDHIRLRAKMAFFAQVESTNNFPTAAGLASSASAFAALTCAAVGAAGLKLGKKELSVLARQGSGSAARSIFGGVVEMHRGRAGDGLDAYAEQIADPSYWDLRMIVVVTDEKEKKTGSSRGMTSSAETSPYYPAWVETSEYDLSEMRTAINKKDIERIGEITEYSCMKMHALMLSTRPALVYWNGSTLEIVHHIRELRRQGIPAWYTVDAGPQVKILTLPEYEQTVQEAMTARKGVKRIICSGLGPDAHLLEDARVD